MKKVGIYFGFLALLLFALFFVNNNSEQTESKETTTVAKNFEYDKSFDIEEDLDIPKVIFVYSDPTDHHPYG